MAAELFAEATSRAKTKDLNQDFGALNQYEVDAHIANVINKDEELSYLSKIHEQATQKHIAEGKSFTDEEFSARAEYVEKVTSKLKDMGLETANTYSKTVNGVTIYTLERAKAHEEIINKVMLSYSEIPSEGKALMAGGLGGAGKGSILSKLGASKMYATINPDDVKEIMADKGLIPKVEGLSPMEVSTLVHEEAGMISNIIARKLITQKKNINYDVTMGGLSSTRSKIENLKDNGYEVRAVFVDIDTETSTVRANSRYKIGLDAYAKSGGKSIGGRPVPKGVNFPSKDGRNSQNADNLVDLYKTGVLKGRPLIYSNMGRTPEKLDFAKFARPL